MTESDRHRIGHIRDYCNAISQTIQRYGYSFEQYIEDQDYQRSICFSILQIGELVGGLSQEYRKATASRVQWGPIKAMRNLVVHGYGSVDHKTIWETVTIDIPALLQFCEEQLQQ